MTAKKFCKLLGLLFVLFVFSAPLAAQTTPELSVNGVRLGDRESAKAFLEKFALAADGKGGFAYFFFNDFGDKVWKLTAASFEDRFMIVEMEVFMVGDNYARPHFYLKKVDHFITESGIFVGKKESLSAAILGEGIATDTRMGPKDLIKKKGEPTNRTKDGERELLTYSINDFGIKDEKGETVKFNYSATYDFRQRKLRRFVIGIGK